MPVEQRALHLLLAGCDFDQTPNEVKREVSASSLVIGPTSGLISIPMTPFRSSAFPQPSLALKAEEEIPYGRTDRDALHDTIVVDHTTEVRPAVWVGYAVVLLRHKPGRG